MDYTELGSRFSCHDYLKLLEVDIQNANALAASMTSAKDGAYTQLRQAYDQLTPFLLFLQWMDCSCSSDISSVMNLFHIVVYKVYSDGKPNVSSYCRKATIREFYEVILPSLQRLHNDLVEMDFISEYAHSEVTVNNRQEERRKISNVDIDREDECGICLEHCTKAVMPSGCHSMCINCCSDWNLRSGSRPFSQGSLKGVSSGDLRVLTCHSDIIDTQTVLREDMLRFYLYINNLPKDVPDALLWVYYEYLI